MTDRPRVALVWYEVHDDGGAEHAVAELVRDLGAEIEFHVVSARLAEDVRPLAAWHRVPAPRRPFLVRFIWFGLRASVRVARLDVDLVHVVGATILNRADLITVQFSHREYVDATGRLAPPGARGLRRVSRTLTRLAGMLAERWAIRPSRLRALAAVSSRQAGVLARLFPGCQVVITPNGSDARAQVPASTRAAIRSAEGLADDAVVVTFVGNDWARKRLDLAVAGVAHAIREAGAPCHLWVIGDGSRKELDALAERAGLPPDRYRHWGLRQDVGELLAASDLFVLPSVYETFGIAAFEAALQGLPVVGTEINGLDELIGADEAGMLCAPTPEAIGQAVAALALDPEDRRRRGERARARAAAYTWERSARATLAQYRALLDGGG
jgi:glycosyltransferase involved in cell wall biosynthesis